MGHVSDTAFFPGQKKKKYVSKVTLVIRPFLHEQKTRITTFGALGGFAFDSTYDIK